MLPPIAVVLAGALALISVPALAGEAKDAGKDPEKVTCKLVKALGSRIPTRECKTNAQWDLEAAAAREAMEQRNRASQCGGGGAC